jgi:archaellum component FlaC
MASQRNDIHHEMEKLDQIITALARVETKLDNVSNTVAQHDEVIDGLQKKWWSGVGAFFLAVGLWLKQLVG